jgi:hypothetical protein
MADEVAPIGEDVALFEERNHDEIEMLEDHHKMAHKL